jgi:hypothetical protein
MVPSFCILYKSLCFILDKPVVKLEAHSLKVTGMCVVAIVLKACVHGLKSMESEKVGELEFTFTILFCCNSEVA